MADALRPGRPADPRPSDVAPAQPWSQGTLGRALLAGTVALLLMLLPAEPAASLDQIDGVGSGGVASVGLE